MTKLNKVKDKAAVRARTSYVDADGEARELDAAFFEGAEFGVLDMKPFEKMRRGRPELPEEERKQKVTMMLDRDIVAHFKKDGRGWQTRLNAALREAIATEEVAADELTRFLTEFAARLFEAEVPANKGKKPKLVPRPELINLLKMEYL